MKKLPLAQPIALSFIALAASTASCGSGPRDARTQAPVSAQLPSEPEPTRPESKEACDACGGLWDIHGLGLVESCICATKDAGKSCMDGQQCEAECIVGEDDQLEVTEPGDVPRGYYVGKCSSYDTTFGCHRTIPAGTLERGPHVADEGTQDVCVD